MTSNARLYCCYIDDAGQAKLRDLPEQTSENSAELHVSWRSLACQEDGEIFVLQEGPAPDDYTHVCRAHIGLMIDETKTTTVWLVQKEGQE